MVGGDLHVIGSGQFSGSDPLVINAAWPTSQPSYPANQIRLVPIVQGGGIGYGPVGSYPRGVGVLGGAFGEFAVQGTLRAVGGVNCSTIGQGLTVNGNYIAYGGGQSIDFGNNDIIRFGRGILGGSITEYGRFDNDGSFSLQGNAMVGGDLTVVNEINARYANINTIAFSSGSVIQDDGNSGINVVDTNGNTFNFDNNTITFGNGDQLSTESGYLLLNGRQLAFADHVPGYAN